MKRYDIFTENIRISIKTIRSSFLRSFLTIMIIALGITALVGILTAISAIESTITNEFGRMGANSFRITNRQINMKLGRRHRTKNLPQISYNQAIRFKDEYTLPAMVSVSVRVTGRSTAKRNEFKTDPNIPVIGGDKEHLFVSGLRIKNGRNFSKNELQYGQDVVIIGSDLAKNLFYTHEKIIGKDIVVGANRYRVIGILEERGKSLSPDRVDKLCIIPVKNAEKNFNMEGRSFQITIIPHSKMSIKIAISEAKGLFRKVRKLSLQDKNDFSITKNDNIAQLLIENISFVTIAATLIGIITLIGSAIGLMNTMLVSVAERTREIGIRKAIGASSKVIKMQFLLEAVIIGIIGGIIGIISGIIIGNVVSVFTGNEFIVPWVWITIGIVLCIATGIGAGIFPAIKASKQDPIEALRYE